MASIQSPSQHYRPWHRPSPADVALHAYDEPHPRETALAWAALVLGCVAFLLAAVGGSMYGLVIGVVGTATAIWAQLVSATTAQRWLVVPGWVLAALGIALNLFFMWE